MKIYNIRLGHATNSSSTHSIIYTDNEVYDEDVEDGEFGWGFFTAASLESKKLYLASILYTNLERQVSTEIALAVVKDWVGVNLIKSEFGGIKYYVDHQSEWNLPLEYNGKGVHKQFFYELKNYILQSGIAILGGNDNTEESHPLLNNEVSLPLSLDEYSPIVARKDDSGYWILFNRDNGTKIRFSFEDLGYSPVKASSPELVDLKITDYCTAKCAYCYQGSTPEGKHASESVINHILYELQKAEVLEIAIGGGAPTDHPNFAKIVASSKAYKIVPNFTTQTLDWLKKDWAKQVLADVGGFAYSVTNHKQIPKFVSELAKFGYPKYPKKLYIHYVLGSTTIGEYRKILETAYINNVQVTLLGYKITGRGCEFKPHNHTEWLNIIKDMRLQKKYIRIGIDTAIAQEYSRTIQLEGISDCLYHINEGKFSCYIDAVTNRIAPSSYSNRELFKEFNSKWLDIFETF